MRLLLAILCAALPGHAAPAARPEALQALDLESRLKALKGRLWELDRALDEDPAVRALIALGDAAAGSKEGAELEHQAAPVLEEHRRTTTPLLVEMTMLALRLDEYRRTGRVPPDVPDRERIERFLRDPWPSGLYPWAPTPRRMPRLELDITALERQLRPPPPLAALPSRAKRAPGPALAKPAAAPLPGVPAAPGPRLERDAGRGRAEVDPVPRLLELLASEDAYQRALAADELGRLGRAAAKAVPALARALGDRDPRVRGGAAFSLGSIGEAPPEALDGVRRLLQDPDGDVRYRAKAALERLKR